MAARCTAANLARLDERCSRTLGENNAGWNEHIAGQVMGVPQAGLLTAHSFGWHGGKSRIQSAETALLQSTDAS